MSKGKQWKEITEAADLGSAKVDREAGLVRGVRVLGLQSANKRTYSRDAVRAAAPLYEGVAVNLNHSRDGRRDVNDRFGWLTNVKAVEDGGLEGDLAYLKSHPMAERFVESVERNPRLWGLSHHALGREDRGGVITEIRDVKSVDLVATPGTTRSLFEEEEPMKLTIGKVIEKAPEKTKGLEVLCELVEMEGMEGAMDLPVEAPSDASPEQLVGDAFKAAIVSVLDDSSLDLAGKKAKIGNILKAQESAEKAMAKNAEKKNDSSEDTKSSESSETTEELDVKKQLAELKRKDEVRELLEEHGHTLKSVPAHITTLIEEGASAKALKAAVSALPKPDSDSSGKQRPKLRGWRELQEESADSGNDRKKMRERLKSALA